MHVSSSAGKCCSADIGGRLLLRSGARVRMLAGRVLDADAVGIDIEDAAADPALLCAKRPTTRRRSRGRIPTHGVPALSYSELDALKKR
jgi:hypothetical protein